MATQAEVIRRNIQDNAARDSRQQLGDFGSSQTEEIARGIPVLNDAALAASIEQWKATDIQYQRAQNDEAREQIEAAYTAGQQRLNRAKQEIRDRAELETVQRNQADSSAGDRLALQIQTLTDGFPPNWTAETLSMDQLRQLSDLRQQVQNLAAATGTQGLDPGVLESGGPLAPANVLGNQVKQARPETFPDGQEVHVTQNQDGTLHVEYVTGEKFDGDPLTVTQRIGQAHVRTKRWSQNRAQSSQAQPAAGPTQLNQQPQQQIISPTQQSTIADYWAAEQADALARQFKFSGKDEMQQWGESVNQKMAKIQEFEDQQLAAQFHAVCPDFPDTPEAANAVMSIVQSQGWNLNSVESLQAGHALAVRQGIYQPLSAEAQRIASGEIPQQHRNAPPPMLHTGNPEISNQQLSPYDMPMGDLRKAAIRQELERQGPNYR